MKKVIEYLKGFISFDKIQLLGFDRVNISVNDNLGTRAVTEYCFEGNNNTYKYLKENSDGREPIAIVLEKDLKYLMDRADKLDSLIKTIREYDWKDFVGTKPKELNADKKKKPTVADMMYGHEGECFSYYPEGSNTPEKVTLEGFAVRDGNVFIIMTRLCSTGDAVWFFEDGRYYDMNDCDYDGKGCVLFPPHKIHWDIYKFPPKQQPEKGEDVYAGKCNKTEHLMGTKYIRLGIVEGVEDSEGFIRSSDVIFSKKEVDGGAQLLTNYGTDKVKMMSRPD